MEWVNEHSRPKYVWWDKKNGNEREREGSRYAVVGPRTASMTPVLARGWGSQGQASTAGVYGDTVVDVAGNTEGKRQREELKIQPPDDFNILRCNWCRNSRTHTPGVFSAGLLIQSQC